MSTTKIVLNRQSDLILTGPQITSPIGLVKEDILNLVSDLENIELSAAAEALARAEGDQAVQNAMKDIQAFLENAIKEGDTTITNALNAAIDNYKAADKVLSTNLKNLQDEHNADVETLQLNIDNEQARAEAAEANLSKNIAFEVKEREKAVATERNERIDADRYLTAELDAEKTRAESAEAGLQSNIDVEKGRIDAILLASDADKDSFAEIVSLINSVDTENDQAFASYVVSNDAALEAEKQSREAGDALLNSALTNETAERTSEDQKLQMSLRQEIDRAESAEAILDSKINTEIENRTAADTSFTNSLNNEILDRSAADKVLQGNLETEVDRATEAEKVLRDTLTSETAERISGDSELSISIQVESDRAITAEANLSKNIANETKARTAAISTERDERIASDDNLTALLGKVEKSVTTERGAREAADASLTASLQAEIADRQAADKGLNTKIVEISDRITKDLYTEKVRIDAILDGSTVDLDQFREVVSFVESIDLANDESLLAEVAKLNDVIKAGDSGLNDKYAAITSELRNDMETADKSLDDKYAAITYDLRADMDAADGELRTADFDLANYVMDMSPRMLSSIVISGEATGVDASVVMYGSHIVFLNGLMQRENIDYSYDGEAFMFSTPLSTGNFVDIYGVPSGITVPVADPNAILPAPEIIPPVDEESYGKGLTEG